MGNDVCRASDRRPTKVKVAKSEGLKIGRIISNPSWSEISIGAAYSAQNMIILCDAQTNL